MMCHETKVTLAKYIKFYKDFHNMKIQFPLFILSLLFSSLAIADVTNSFYDNAELASSWARSEFSSLYSSPETNLIVPTFTYHLPFGYSTETLATLNPWPIGLGLGKSITDEHGRYKDMMIMVFSDSHRDPEPTVAYTRTWPMIGDRDTNISGGFVVFITSRSDTGIPYIPFPALLPLMSVKPIEKFKVSAAYVPSLAKNTGNVVFFTSSFTF